MNDEQCGKTALHKVAPEGVLCGSELSMAAIGSGLWPHGLISASQKLCKLRGEARATQVGVAIGF